MLMLKCGVFLSGNWLETYVTRVLLNDSDASFGGWLQYKLTKQRITFGREFEAILQPPILRNASKLPSCYQDFWTVPGVDVRGRP